MSRTRAPTLQLTGDVREMADKGREEEIRGLWGHAGRGALPSRRGILRGITR